MRKKRIPSSSRKPSSAERKADELAPKEGATPSRKFLGVSLSGGKADKACVAVLEYYPEQKKVFLSQLLEKIRAEEFLSADLKIHEVIAQYQGEADMVAFDVPLSLPKCTNCDLPCPGYEVCTEAEIKFMRNLYSQDVHKRKPKKMYTPYTQRAVEAYLTHQYSELDIHHALGANLAPLTMRGIFISKRLETETIEVSTRISVHLLGLSLKVNKAKLKSYRNSVGGEEAREMILKAMTDKWQIFFYRQDFKSMIENCHAFEAFIAAYTAYLQVLGMVEPRPAELPLTEPWLAIPKS